MRGIEINGHSSIYRIRMSDSISLFRSIEVVEFNMTQEQVMLTDNPDDRDKKHKKQQKATLGGEKKK